MRFAISLTAAVLFPVALTAHAAICDARSGPQRMNVVELYTSEGCSSCPPADRWLSTHRNDPDTVALAFHVDYWDRLGWKDRFSSPEFTQRQSQQQAVNGARFSYTPQVVVNGIDMKDWRALPSPMTRSVTAVQLALTKQRDEFVVSVKTDTVAPATLTGYWAVTEGGHTSRVEAGENGGSTLHHDFVVRETKVIARWTPAAGSPSEFHFSPKRALDPMHPREVVFIVIDGLSGRPVQAIKSGC